MKLKERFMHYLLKRRRRLYFRLVRIPLFLSATQDADFWNLHDTLLADHRCTQLLRERYNLWTLARRAQQMPGAYAEAGVYDGGSAKILCTVKGNAELHLFDTFEGMPATDRRSDPFFIEGQFADTSLQKVTDYLREFKNVHFHPGFFPDSAAALPSELKFKFVHLDLDLYKSTLGGLRFFYPRLVHKGFIVAHDYGNLTVPGVKQAFDEFVAEVNEPLVQLWETQCVLIKSAA